jgi:hypothetical protein
VDRNTASSGIKSGLAFASLAVGIFGLTFFAAIVYIG